MRWLAGAAMALSAGGVHAACTVSTPLNIVFGSYVSPGGTAIDRQTAITVTCSTPVILGLLGIPLACNSDTFNYTIKVASTLRPGYAPQTMASASGLLGYNLFTDFGRTIVWGNGTVGTSTVTGSISIPGTLILGTCTQSSPAHTIYARVPAAQNVPAGSYTDTIMVTVEY